MAGGETCSHSDFAGCACALEKVVCENGGHTNFLLMECGKCGAAVPFPEENFRLITPEAKEWVSAELAKMGLELAPEYAVNAKNAS